MAEPRPHVEPRRYGPLAWPAGTRRQLVPFSGPLETDLVTLLEQRQTRRDFIKPLTDEELGSFLWLTCRSRSLREGPFGTPQESRPHPSAGGMHPIHVLTARRGELWFRYDPVSHALVELPGTAAGAAAARGTADELLPTHEGLLLSLLAEPGKTAAKYAEHASLVWRDAGVLLGYMSVVAEAMQLSFCPLGLLGDLELGGWAPPGALFGTGLALLGRP